MNNTSIKTILFIAAVMVAEVSFSQSSGWMADASVVSSPEQDESLYPQAWVWGSKTYKDSNWGISSFVLVGKAWGELLVGPSYTFKGNRGFTEIGTQVGLETYPSSPYRGSLYIFHKTPGDENGRHELTYLAFGEYGGSGQWHTGFVNYNVTKRFGVGALAQYGTVYGPRLQINVPNGFIYLSGGQDLENDAPGAMIGIRMFM